VEFFLMCFSVIKRFYTLNFRDFSLQVPNTISKNLCVLDILKIYLNLFFYLKKI